MTLFEHLTECYDHRDGSVSKANGSVDEKVNDIEIPNEYLEENGAQQISAVNKVNYSNYNATTLYFMICSYECSKHLELIDSTNEKCFMCR